MSHQSSFPKYQILGVEVDAVTMTQALDYIAGWVTDPARPAAAATKPYVEFFDQAARQRELKQLLNDVELCLPDGVALQWATRFRYRSPGHWWDGLRLLVAIVTRPQALADPLPERFRGITFTQQLLERAQRDQLSLFLIGSPRHQNITETATAITERFVGIKIAGTFSGRFTPDQEPELVQQLQATRPDIILIGMGFPAQEYLRRRLLPQLGHGFIIGEGGSFDYEELGGRIPRAPRWMQDGGVEWLWRLWVQPGRIWRQVAIPRFIVRVWRSKPRQSIHDPL